MFSLELLDSPLNANLEEGLECLLQRTVLEVSEFVVISDQEKAAETLSSDADDLLEVNLLRKQSLLLHKTEETKAVETV